MEVKFRLLDDTYISPSKYDHATTVSALKDFILARWPQVKPSVESTTLKLHQGSRTCLNFQTKQDRA